MHPLLLLCRPLRTGLFSGPLTGSCGPAVLRSCVVLCVSLFVPPAAPRSVPRFPLNSGAIVPLPYNTKPMHQLKKHGCRIRERRGICRLERRLYLDSSSRMPPPAVVVTQSSLLVLYAPPASRWLRNRRDSPLRRVLKPAKRKRTSPPTAFFFWLILTYGSISSRIPCTAPVPACLALVNNSSPKAIASTALHAAASTQ